MARPSKTNIGSFPFDVDFFDNKIMVRIAGEYGIKGEIIAIKLLCAVYKQGYFMKWSIDERALLIRYLPGISLELLDQVINRLLKWGFFDENLFMSAQILTSFEIQKTYFNAIKRRTGLDRNSFPYLLLDPEHPNNISAYRNKVSVDNTIVSVDNNPDKVNENGVYVIKNPNSCNKNKNPGITTKQINVAETGVSVYNNSNKCNNNSNFCNSKSNSGFKNPLDEHFVSQKELIYTETGVSVDNNQGLCNQKPVETKNNNHRFVANNVINVNNNPDNVSNNGEKDNNNGISDNNNTANIIYNRNSNNSSSRSSCCNKTREQKDDFGEQKGKERIQELEKDLIEIQKDQIWIESLCMNYHLTPSQIPELLQRFKNHCIIEDKEPHLDLSKLKTHISRWIPYSNINPQKITKKNYGTDETRKDTRNQRRRTDITPERKENYNTTF